MTAEQRAWVEALRSGEYEQTRGILTRINSDEEPVGHCCLGVACDLAVKAGVIEPGKPIGKNGVHPRLRYGEPGFSDDLGLPPAVQRWLNVRDGDGRFVTIENGEQFLSSLNDEGATFTEIAAIIEENAEQIFK